MSNKKSPVKFAGVSLVEIIISMLILSLIMGGLANLFISTKRLTLHARSRMVGGELSRYFLNHLQLQVRQDTWNDSTNFLTQGEYKSSDDIPCSGYSTYSNVTWLDEPNLDGITYYPAQRVSVIDGLRKVRLTICWEEPS